MRSFSPQRCFSDLTDHTGALPSGAILSDKADAGGASAFHSGETEQGSERGSRRRGSYLLARRVPLGSMRIDKLVRLVFLLNSLYPLTERLLKQHFAVFSAQDDMSIQPIILML